MNRTYRSGQPGQAIIDVPEVDDAGAVNADLVSLDPRDGRLIVIESPYYPLPWVGPIVQVAYQPSRGEFRVTAQSFEYVLQGRILPSEFTFGGTAGAVLNALIEQIETSNPVGLTVSENNASGPYIADTEFGDRTLFDALNILAKVSGFEWWLEHEIVRGGVLQTTVHFGTRGQDRYRDLQLTTGPHGNVDVSECRISVDTTVHRLRGVAGQRTITEAYSDRIRVERRLSLASPLGEALQVDATRIYHGHAFQRSPTGGAVLTSAEQVQVVEAVRGTGDLAIATEAILRQGRSFERAIDLDLVGDFETWKYALPGDVIRLTLPAPYFIDGYDGPVRVISSRPMEQLGKMQLVLEVPGA